MALRQRLDADGIVELRPFGPQRPNAIALTVDLDAELGEPLRLERRFELDLVDMDRRDHERSDDDKMNESHGINLPAADGAMPAATYPRPPAAGQRCGWRPATWLIGPADWHRPRRHRPRPGGA